MGRRRRRRRRAATGFAAKAAELSKQPPQRNRAQGRRRRRRAGERGEDRSRRRTSIRSSRTRRSSRRTPRRTSRTASSRSGRRRQTAGRRPRAGRADARHSSRKTSRSTCTRIGRRLRAPADQRLHGRGGGDREAAARVRSSCSGRAKTTSSTTSIGRAGFHYLKGGVDASGQARRVARTTSSRSARTASRRARASAATEFPARFIPNFVARRVGDAARRADRPLRAPGSNGIAFVVQSFIDELAHAAGKDPLQFRLDLLANEQPAPPPAAPPARRRRWTRWSAGAGLRRRAHARRARAGRARSRAGARRTLPEGHRHGRRVPLQPSRLLRRGRAGDGDARPATVKVDKVWVAGDIGSQIINPSNAENQVQGAVLDGIAEALARRSRSRRAGRADELPQLPAAAHASGAAGRSVIREVSDSPDRARRAGAAAGGAGAVQRDLRGDRQARAVAAAVEAGSEMELDAFASGSLTASLDCFVLRASSTAESLAWPCTVALRSQPGAEAGRRPVRWRQSPSATLVASRRCKVGDLLYLSGQLPARGDSTIEGQTKSALEKMNPILAAAGTSKEKIVKCTVFLIDVKDFAGMNKAYAEFFARRAAGALHGGRRGARDAGREARGGVYCGVEVASTRRSERSHTALTGKSTGISNGSVESATDRILTPSIGAVQFRSADHRTRGPRRPLAMIRPSPRRRCAARRAPRRAPAITGSVLTCAPGTADLRRCSSRFRSVSAAREHAARRARRAARRARRRRAAARARARAARALPRRA